MIYKAAISGIDKLTPSAFDLLSKYSTIAYVKPNTEKELIDVLQSVDIFWFRLNHKLTRNILKTAKCKYILCAVTGLDHIDIEACSDFGITIISLKGEAEFLKEVRATAEHTLSLMLTLVRKSKNAFKHVENGNWDRTKFQGLELYKKNVGVLGYGRLGKIVADYCQALGMTVYFYDVEEKEHNPNHIACSSVEELCQKSDVLTIHIPYTKETEFFLNKRVLANLKPTSFIVNTSRGGVIKEDAIIELLNENAIAGYATDVLYNEPITENNALVNYAQQNANVIITPHIGGNTFESIEKTEFFIAKKLIEKLV